MRESFSSWLSVLNTHKSTSEMASLPMISYLVVEQKKEILIKNYIAFAHLVNVLRHLSRQKHGKLENQQNFKSKVKNREEKKPKDGKPTKIVINIYRKILSCGWNSVNIFLQQRAMCFVAVFISDSCISVLSKFNSLTVLKNVKLSNQSNACKQESVIPELGKISKRFKLLNFDATTAISKFGDSSRL